MQKATVKFNSSMGSYSSSIENLNFSIEIDAEKAKEIISMATNLVGALNHESVSDPVVETTVWDKVLKRVNSGSYIGEHKSAEYKMIGTSAIEFVYEEVYLSRSENPESIWVDTATQQVEVFSNTVLNVVTKDLPLETQSMIKDLLRGLLPDN